MLLVITFNAALLILGICVRVAELTVVGLFGSVKVKIGLVLVILIVIVLILTVLW